MRWHRLEEQSAERVDQRCERPLLGEPADPARHGLGPDKDTAEDRQQRHRKHDVACRFGISRLQTWRDADPRNRERRDAIMPITASQSSSPAIGLKPTRAPTAATSKAPAVVSSKMIGTSRVPEKDYVPPPRSHRHRRKSAWSRCSRRLSCRPRWGLAGRRRYRRGCEAYAVEYDVVIGLAQPQNGDCALCFGAHNCMVQG